MAEPVQAVADKLVGLMLSAVDMLGEKMDAYKRGERITIPQGQLATVRVVFQCYSMLVPRAAKRPNGSGTAEQNLSEDQGGLSADVRARLSELEDLTGVEPAGLDE
jgi:hypothetical protein